MAELSRRVAFFDLDNTVIDGSSIYYFVKGLAKSGILQLVTQGNRLILAVGGLRLESRHGTFSTLFRHIFLSFGLSTGLSSRFLLCPKGEGLASS